MVAASLTVRSLMEVSVFSTALSVSFLPFCNFNQFVTLGKSTIEQQTCHGTSGDLREDLENPRQNSTVKID
jgi:hypothetical protein